jgi:hypothetical protein
MSAEVVHMKKSTIARTWIGGLAVFAAGIFLSIVGVALMLAYGGTFTQVAGTNSFSFAPDMSAVFWATVGVTVFGGMLSLIGSIVQFVAWIGGLFNSYLLTSKGWFAVLLGGGVLSFAFAPIGFAAMLAYVVAAPDGEPYAQRRVPAMTQTPLAPTT